MDYKEGVKELLKQFIPPGPDYPWEGRGIFELTETTGLISSMSRSDLSFVIKAEIVFRIKKGKTRTIIGKKAELPIKDTGNFLEQLLRFQEDFYKALYVQLVRYTLFVKEATLVRHNGEPFEVTPISKLILGDYKADEE